MSRQSHPGFSLAMHHVVGRTLGTMRQTLLTASVLLGNTYRKAVMARVDRPRRALDRLRDRLDACVCAEYLTEADVTRIYYAETETRVSFPTGMSLHSLEGVCAMLASQGGTMTLLAELLYAHYPVTLGDAALRIAQTLTYEAQELPMVVGLPKRAQRGAARRAG
jgi:hypothetical protein